MKINVKFNETDTLNPTVKILLKIGSLIVSFLFLSFAGVQIFCLIAKPQGGEEIIDMLGNHYIQQAILGVLFLAVFIMMNRSKIKN